MTDFGDSSNPFVSGGRGSDTDSGNPFVSFTSSPSSNHTPSSSSPSSSPSSSSVSSSSSPPSGYVIDYTASPAKQFASAVSYLRNVHLYCYFSCRQYSSMDQMLSLSGEAYFFAPTPVSDSSSTPTTTTTTTATGPNTSSSQSATKGDDFFAFALASAEDYTRAIVDTVYDIEPPPPTQSQEILSALYRPSSDIPGMAVEAYIKSVTKALVVKGQTVYKCELCLKAFNSQNTIHTHITSKHNDLLAPVINEAHKVDYFLRYATDPLAPTFPLSSSPSWTHDNTASSTTKATTGLGVSAPGIVAGTSTSSHTLTTRDRIRFVRLHNYQTRDLRLGTAPPIITKATIGDEESKGGKRKGKKDVKTILPPPPPPSEAGGKDPRDIISYLDITKLPTLPDIHILPPVKL